MYIIYLYTYYYHFNWNQARPLHVAIILKLGGSTREYSHLRGVKFPQTKGSPPSVQTGDSCCGYVTFAFTQHGRETRGYACAAHRTTLLSNMHQDNALKDIALSHRGPCARNGHALHHDMIRGRHTYISTYNKYVYIYLSLSLSIYIYIHIHTCTHTNLPTYPPTHLHTYTPTNKHIHIYTYTHIHIYTYTHIHIYTYTQYINYSFSYEGGAPARSRCTGCAPIIIIIISI